MNPIDEHFKRDLEKVEITPSADLWKAKIAPQIAQKKAAPVLWYRAAAVIILLVGSWFAFNFIVQNNNVPIIAPSQNNVVLSPEVLPAITIYPAKTETVIVPEKDTKNIATAVKQTVKKVHKQSTIPLEILPEEEMKMAQVEETTPAKSEYKIKLRINLAKYAATEVVAESKNAKPTVTAYAKAQWGNITKGEKVDAPPKAWFDLPKLALRVDGNPLNVLLPKTAQP